MTVHAPELVYPLPGDQVIGCSCGWEQDMWEDESRTPGDQHRQWQRHLAETFHR